jgi:Flp pilus assembly pilin Flp
MHSPTTEDESRALHETANAMKREEGVVSSEYGVLLGLIAVFIVAAATAFGVAVAGLFSHGASAVPGA